MDLGLRGRVAIVAAASKGLGRVVAEELAREGADVAICARTALALEQAAAAIRAAGGDLNRNGLRRPKVGLFASDDATP